MEKNEHYHLIIVGGGPIGIACALEAKKLGISYLILERGTLVNSLYNYPVNMTFFSTSERLEIGGVPFVSHHPKPNRNEALEYYRRVARDNQIRINLFEEVLQIHPVTGPQTRGKKKALPETMRRQRMNPPSQQSHRSKETELKENQLAYEVVTTRNTYAARNIIVATGFYDIPYLLNVPGEALPKVRHYYKDPHFYAFQKVLIVGAQNSAVDAALETWRKGAEVTMVIRGAEIGKRVKYWVRPDIENRIKEGSIKAYFNSYVSAIREKEVDVQTPDGLVRVQNDWVLSMTGYQPDLPFLRKVGIQLCDDDTNKPVYDEETHETNLPHIYLAGVICGGLNTHRLFIENSREHAVRILKNIAKQSP